jgi:hypothetical protein
MDDLLNGSVLREASTNSIFSSCFTCMGIRMDKSINYDNSRETSQSVTAKLEDKFYFVLISRSWNQPSTMECSHEPESSNSPPVNKLQIKLGCFLPSYSPRDHSFRSITEAHDPIWVLDRRKINKQLLSIGNIVVS